MQMKAQEDVACVLVDEATSRAAQQVDHTGQGQDEHAATPCASRKDHLPLHGLDSAWSCSGNPHRQRGDQGSWLRQTLAQAGGH